MCLMKTFFFGLGIFCPNSNGVEEGNPCNLTDGLFIEKFGNLSRHKTEPISPVGDRHFGVSISVKIDLDIRWEPQMLIRCWNMHRRFTMTSIESKSQAFFFFFFFLFVMNVPASS